MPEPDTATLQQLLAVQDELISTEPDMGTLMALVAARSAVLTKADGAAVELAEGTDMVYRAVSGMAAGQLGLRLSRQGSFSGLCVEKHEALICHDSEEDSRVNRAACRAVGLRSMVVQPLFHRENVIGVVKVMSSRPQAFSETALTLLGLLSRTVAGVLANAQRWNSLRDDNDNLAHVASHDALTGIKNRSAFYDQLRQSIAHAKRSGEQVGVALFDLDGLKHVNDTYGHQAGDFFIKSFAERLTKRAREADTVARLGGDEFGLLFAVDNGVDPQSVARQIADQAEGTVRFAGALLQLKTSAGVSVFADDGPDVETLVARADERLYGNKRERKGA